MATNFPPLMSELRWVLLLAGVLFLLVLAGWELSRARRARRAAELEAREAVAAAFAGAAPAAAESQAAEPSLSGESESAMDVGTETQTIGGPESAAAKRIEPTFDEPTFDEPELIAAVAPLTPSAPIEASPPLRVEWPAERERQILALRIVAPAGGWLGGRLVRQALGACGFVHGPYRIYHQPAADGRALLSCANLTKPGDFDPLTLDFQRLTGLSLFTVLPAALPPLAALEHLLETAQDLAQRVHAELADERGAPLDAARVAQLSAIAQEWAGPQTRGAAYTAGAGGSSGASGA